jgi:light-regulated signal transduction histidine kinase (bacteriophytochrome)
MAKKPQIDDQVALQREELEELRSALDHDFRAPVRAVDGFSEALAEVLGPDLAPEAKEYLELVRRSARRMGEMIEVLHELHRVSSAPVARVELDLSQCATNAMRHAALRHRRADVRTTVPGPTFTHADPALAPMVLEALVDNAFKFTRPNAVAHVEFGKQSGGSAPIYFVRDDGVGFDMAYAKRLFAPFRRLHREDEFEGLGVGLATARRAVRRHGGRIWAHAEPGRGATFHFTLEAAR